MANERHAKLYEEDLEIIQFLKGNEKLIYVTIIFHANPKYKDEKIRVRSCFMSQKTLTKTSGMSQATVTRAIRHLKALNILTVQNRFGNSAIYTITTSLCKDTKSSSVDYIVKSETKTEEKQIEKSNSSSVDHSKSSTDDHSKSSSVDHSRSSHDDQQTNNKQNNKQNNKHVYSSSYNPNGWYNRTLKKEPSKSEEEMKREIEEKLESIESIEHRVKRGLENQTFGDLGIYRLQMSSIDAFREEVQQSLSSEEFDLYKSEMNKNKMVDLKDLFDTSKYIACPYVEDGLNLTLVLYKENTLYIQKIQDQVCNNIGSTVTQIQDQVGQQYRIKCDSKKQGHIEKRLHLVDTKGTTEQMSKEKRKEQLEENIKEKQNNISKTKFFYIPEQGGFSDWRK